jgi:hypothetical protein
MQRSKRPIALLLSTAFIGALTLIRAHAASPATPNPATARREIQALYDRMNGLVKKNERYAAKRHFLDHTTDDFVDKQKNGRKVSREDAAEVFDSGLLSVAKFTQVVSRITSLTVKGSDVIVVYKDHTAFLLPDSEGKSRRVSISSTNRDTWVKTEEGWKTRIAEQLTSQTLVDGKPPRTAKRGKGSGGAEDDDPIGAWGLGPM